MKQWQVMLAGPVFMLLVWSQPAQAGAGGCQYSACTAAGNITQNFTAGTSWTFSLASCPCEGLVIIGASYTPRGGAPRYVLHQGSIAQIHVPYLTGSPRFVDVTDSTTGLGVNAITLSAAECSGGTLYLGGKICVNVEDRGYAWKYSTSFQHGESVSAFMASQLGQYTYVNHWEFHDDGTIEPRLALTGRLQKVDSGAAFLPYGSRLNPESDPTPRVGISHMHNIYYRLDFDINGSGNDAVERRTRQASNVASPNSACSTPGQCATNVATQLLTETADHFIPEAYTTWRVYDKATLNADGRPVGYEIIPHIAGLWSGMTSTTEPWSAHEFWVTNYNGCEMLATENHVPHINPACSGSADSVSQMVNGGSVDGQDVVLWYANRVLHVPRDEDEVNMPVEWVSFEIKPRNFHHKNPLEP